MEPIAPSCKRPKPSNGVDATADSSRFNDLPEQVVHHIFSFLETIDVMRASAVSRKWRYLWTSMPHLNFIHYTGVYETFKDFVNWVLMALDKSASIQSCHLSCLNNDDDRSLYRWLHILAQKHVRELHLNLTYESDRENPFFLPCCLFASDSLQVLELDLWTNVLKIPSNEGFSRLKSLRLANTRLMDQNLFHNFISGCHLLENLSLEQCVFHDFKVLEISLKNLRKLVINGDHYCLPFDEGLRKCDLKIACPNLLYFDLRGPFVQSLSWGKNPSFLKTAIIFAFCYDDPVLNDEFATFVLEILRGYIYPAAVRPGCCFTIFYNLKSLKVCAWMGKCYLQSIIYLLKCSPNLELLLVHIDDEMQEYDYEWKIPDEAIACLTYHLRMVKLIETDCSDYELELIRFFLEYGLVLEKLSIIWYCDVQQESQREAIHKIMKLPRSSSHVTVTFSEIKEFDCYDL